MSFMEKHYQILLKNARRDMEMENETQGLRFVKKT